MPTGVLGRIRWLFLGFTLINIVGMLPLLIWRSSDLLPLRCAGMIACLVLTVLWVRGYRRARALLSVASRSSLPLSSY